ncbi:electron transfer flavoprotein subunit beta/FixA family protein [bacterium]|nr:electron transfer flavoprotein subunit beta/FixA family protein [bacterium]
MNSVVCIKRVPETAEATLKIAPDGKKLEEENLVFSLNDADNYALEQALLLQEEFDGDVTVISVGPPETDEIIRMALAKGATNAIRIHHDDISKLDASAVASLLAEQIKDLDYDVVFTGAFASDDAFSLVGTMLARKLEIPHITMAIEMKQDDEDEAEISRELEGGLIAKYRIKFPAVITVQTGMNEPRYASILGIKRASQKEVDVVDDPTIPENKVQLEKISYPPEGKKAEILSGTPEETSSRLAEILKQKGII